MKSFSIHSVRYINKSNFHSPIQFLEICSEDAQTLHCTSLNNLKVTKRSANLGDPTLGGYPFKMHRGRFYCVAGWFTEPA